MAVTPPPPAGLPGVHPPPPPRGLPAAGGACTSTKHAIDLKPPPPSGLPTVKSGKATLAGQPPPPAQHLPPARTKANGPPPVQRRQGGRAKLARAEAIEAAPPPPPPPMAQGELPGAPRIGSSSAEVNRRRQQQAVDEGSSLTYDQEYAAWKQLLQDSSDGQGSSEEDSGEDSDEEHDKKLAADRMASDMATLKRQGKGVVRDSRRANSTPNVMVERNMPVPEDNSACNEMNQMLSSTSASSSSVGKRPSLLGRISSKVRASLIPGACAGGDRTSTGSSLQSLLHEDSTRYQKDWYDRWESRLSLEGLSCTKVATNGKPYERKLHVDSRNCTIEVRGGRGGATGILLDDLVDARMGLSSPEFDQFCAKFKKSRLDVDNIDQRGLVLQTGNRTFSFLFPTTAQREIFLHFVVSLLRTRRGCQDPQVAESMPQHRALPAGSLKKQANINDQDEKENGISSAMTARGASIQELPGEGTTGKGQRRYPNNSLYEGDLVDGARHGYGVLQLPDGTRYESEWRNDERSGKGKEVWADGTHFAGSYMKGMRHGYGVMTWPEGSRYSGQFEKGRANGIGELVRTDGSIYRGHFKEDCMSGEGQMLWQDGVQYVGQFVENRRDGFGKMIWTIGRWRSYEGEWKDGMQHGRGTLTDVTNLQCSGYFECGKLESWDDDEEGEEEEHEEEEQLE